MAKWERIEYRGWKNCYCWENQRIKLIVTADVGPRVIYFGNPDGTNQFYEVDEEAGTAQSETYCFYGGHRFWTAPEDLERSYIPDNSPVDLKIHDGKLVTTSRIEPSGIQKTLVIENYKNENSVKVTHTLENKGAKPIELAPWGLSMMKAGGTAIIPMAAKASHSSQLTPSQSLTLWGYTDITDPRWGWGEKFLFLRQDERVESPQKIGVHTGQDWAAYLNGDTLFIKISEYQPGAAYPDFGSHFEFFTNNLFLELESLGELVTLQPGQTVSHLEYWSLYDKVKTVVSDEGIEGKILPLVKDALGAPKD